MAGLTRRIRASRWANRNVLRGEDEMVCSRAHREDWRAFILVVDALFIVLTLRWHRHCRDCATWEASRRPKP